MAGNARLGRTRTLATIAFGSLVTITLGLPGVLALPGFGTQVLPGDQDHVPITSSASRAVMVNEGEFGLAVMANDNCLLLDTAPAPTAGAQYEDLRLTQCMGKRPGTLLADADDVEKLQAYPSVALANVQYADVNANNKYDKGDAVFITTGPVATLTPTGATGAWTVRLTPYGELPAGSFVMAGEPDLVSYGRITKALASSVVKAETKQWYLIPIAAGFARGSLLPENSIRLGGPAYPEAMLEVKAIALDADSLPPGAPMRAAIEVKNAGKAAAALFVETLIDGVVVDGRGSPWLGPGQTATLTLALNAPMSVGEHKLAAGAVETAFQVVAAASAPVTAAPEPVDTALIETRLDVAEQEAAQHEASLFALREQIADLEEELAVLIAAQADAGDGAPAVQQASTPGAGAPLVALSLVGAVMLVRRRGW